MRMEMHTIRQLTLSATILAGLVTGSVLHPRAATAATYYVATTGDNSRSCSTTQNINAPRASITSGLACLSGAGDILYIRGGIYNEEILSGTYPSGSSWNNISPGGSVVWIGAYQTSGIYENVTIQSNGSGGAVLAMYGPNYVVWDHLHTHS